MNKPLHCNHTSVVKNSLKNFSKATSSNHSTKVVG
uniref:Uncharacterized protein n=1 Tax=Arundo donax TaxID=35708 RepID=A0A0A9F9K5_ARUDO